MAFLCEHFFMSLAVSLEFVRQSPQGNEWTTFTGFLAQQSALYLNLPININPSIHPSTYSTTPRHPLETAFFELPFSYCQVSIEASIWLGQSSQMWKDLFLLNLKNSTIPKVFISEIVNFPSFRIQTFHISCTPPRFTPALSRTLFTLREGLKKKALFVVFYYEWGGGGLRKCEKTTKLFYKSCFCWCVPVCSWTPKTCFTLGLECLCHIYST